MWHRILFIGFLLSLQAQAFYLPFRPIEQIRYRSGACGDDLQRVTYALLKEKTYRGCLEAAQDSLSRPGSRLFAQFDGSFNLKRKGGVHYDPDLKLVLMNEIRRRLEVKTPDSEPVPMMQELKHRLETRRKAVIFKDPLPVTPESRDQFRKHLAIFCKHAPALKGGDGEIPAKRIESGLEHLKIDRLFDGFRRTLHVAEAFEHQNPQILKGMKRLRERFLLVLNQMVILKKALAGQELPEGVVVDEVMRNVVLRTEWINAYAELKKLALMSDACQEDRTICNKAFSEMDWLASIVASFDDLKNACWSPKNAHIKDMGLIHGARQNRHFG